MKKDKSLEIFLMVLFGISSIAILTLAWLWPMPGLERILTILIGIFGLFIAFSRIPQLRSAKVATDMARVMAPVKVQHKS